MTKASIGSGTLSSVASGTNIVLQATNDVIFAAAIFPKLGTGSLTVDAGNNIQINAGIFTGGGALKLTANHLDYASSTGMILIGSGGSINTNGGSLTMSEPRSTCRARSPRLAAM